MLIKDFTCVWSDEGGGLKVKLFATLYTETFKKKGDGYGRKNTTRTQSIEGIDSKECPHMAVHKGQC